MAECGKLQYILSEMHFFCDLPTVNSGSNKDKLHKLSTELRNATRKYVRFLDYTPLDVTAFNTFDADKYEQLLEEVKLLQDREEEHHKHTSTIMAILLNISRTQEDMMLWLSNKASVVKHSGDITMGDYYELREEIIKIRDIHAKYTRKARQVKEGLSALSTSIRRGSVNRELIDEVDNLVNKIEYIIKGEDDE